MARRSQLGTADVSPQAAALSGFLPQLALFSTTRTHRKTNPFQAALDDIHAALSHALDDPITHHASKHIVGGVSAGGNLALGISTRLGSKTGRTFEELGMRGVSTPSPMDDEV